MKWWQKKVKGLLRDTDTPLHSKRFADLRQEQKNKLVYNIRKQRRK